MADETFNKDDQLFLSLVLNFQSSAMIGLGKVVNPLTQKTERNLQEAQFSIDILTMLANKTKGNLSQQEDTLVQRILTELRLNYLDELKKEESKKKEGEGKEEEEQDKKEKAEETPEPKQKEKEEEDKGEGEKEDSSEKDSSDKDKGDGKVS